MDHGWIVTLAIPPDRRLGARLSRASVPSAIPTTAEQPESRAACLCIANAGRGRPLLPRLVYVVRELRGGGEAAAESVS